MFQVCYEEIEVQNKCLIVALCISLFGGITSESEYIVIANKIRIKGLYVVSLSSHKHVVVVHTMVIFKANNLGKTQNVQDTNEYYLYHEIR